MMKIIPFTLSIAFTLSSSVSFAAGVNPTQDLAAKIAKAIGTKTVSCSSSTDKITLEVDSKGFLRMIAEYSGEISGKLDTDDEGDGSECGGLSVKTSTRYSTYVLDDSYNDCERGYWGYRIMILQRDLDSISAGVDFPAHAYTTDGGSAGGDGTSGAAVRVLKCTVK